MPCIFIERPNVSLSFIHRHDTGSKPEQNQSYVPVLFRILERPVAFSRVFRDVRNTWFVVRKSFYHLGKRRFPTPRRPAGACVALLRPRRVHVAYAPRRNVTRHYPTTLFSVPFRVVVSNTIRTRGAVVPAPYPSHPPSTGEPFTRSLVCV